jgi:hypothetical protein
VALLIFTTLALELHVVGLAPGRIFATMAVDAAVKALSPQ